MKLIDEKGRLFGIVNPVDLIVIVLILAIVGGVGYRFLSGRLNAEGSSTFSKEQDVYITLVSQLVIPEVAESLNIGDKLVANNQFTDAEIVDIQVKPADYVGYNSEGKAVYSEHPLWKDVTVIVKGKANPSDVILKVGEQEARVNYPFILKTQTVEANCKIRGIEFSELQQEDKR